MDSLNKSTQHQNLMPPKSYDNIAEKYANIVDDKPFHTMYERPNFLNIFPKPEASNGATILDLGCGTGWYAEQFINTGAKVIAVDSNKIMVERTEQRLANKNIKCYCHDLNHPMEFLANNSINYIAAPLIIHYIEDWQKFFAEAYRVLKPNGKFCFSTHHPCGDIEQYNLQNYFLSQTITDYWEGIGEVKFYHRSLATLFQAIHNAGFILENLTEPRPLPCLQEVEPQLFARLSTKPVLLFVCLIKPK